MTPEVSRAVASAKHAMGDPSGPVLDELIRLAETTERVEDLPAWVQALIPPEAGADVEPEVIVPDEAVLGGDVRDDIASRLADDYVGTIVRPFRPRARG